MSPRTSSLHVVVLKAERFYGELICERIRSHWRKAQVQVFQRGLEALRTMQSRVPDLLVVGVRIFDMDGLEHLEPFIRRDLPVLIVTSCRDERSFALLRAVRYDGLYDTTAEGMDNFSSALEQALNHRTYVSPTFLPLINPPEDCAAIRLTETEQRVLSIIGEGADDQEAAARFGLSSHTINTHRKKIMSKLHVHQKGELIRYALHKGYVHFTADKIYRPGFQRCLDQGNGKGNGPANT